MIRPNECQLYSFDNSFLSHKSHLQKQEFLLVQVHRLLESFCPMVDHESYVS